MNKERNISFTFNFNAPIGQQIAHVDKIEAHFDKDMTMQVVDTRGLIDASASDSKEELGGNSFFEVPESVKECFRFPSEFVRQQVEAIVNDFYLGEHVNLAMIEVTLYDHGQLKKRNEHTAFVRALKDWAILSTDVDIAKTASGMASKLRNPFPTEGYKKWGKYYLNERNLCTNIGNRLPETMKYAREVDDVAIGRYEQAQRHGNSMKM